MSTFSTYVQNSGLNNESKIWVAILTESDKPASEGHQWVRQVRSDVMQLKASFVPPILTIDLEAKIESPKTEIQSPKEIYNQHRTLWPVGMKSIFLFWDCVATSTSSVIRLTRPAIDHLPQAGGWRRAVSIWTAFIAEDSFKNGCRFE